MGTKLLAHSHHIAPLWVIKWSDVPNMALLAAGWAPWSDFRNERPAVIKLMDSCLSQQTYSSFLLPPFWRLGKLNTSFPALLKLGMSMSHGFGQWTLSQNWLGNLSFLIKGKEIIRPTSFSFSDPKRKTECRCDVYNGGNHFMTIKESL